MIRRCLNCMQEFQIPAGYENENFCCPHCGFVEGTPPKEANHLHPGTVLQNRYQVGVVVGFGGFGITYKAWDRELGITVAIKEYYPTGLVTREPGQKEVIVYEGSHRDEYYTGLERFLEEARRTAQFEHSKYIVQVRNFFQENSTAYLVMEFLDGISLKEYLKMNHTIDPSTALQITDSVIEALKEMHKAGILHRDIGPGNIFICGNHVKVIDFGAARLSDEDREVTRSIVLTPGFAPPEQYQTKSKQGPWTDIYALAATLYNMVTGKKPDESTDRVQEDLVEEACKIDPNISVGLSNAIMKGMALSPELRFRTVEEFEEAIHERKAVDTPKEELRKKKRKRALQIALISAVIVAGLVIAGLFYLKEYREEHLQAATITVWIPCEDGESKEDAKTRMEETISFFAKNYSQITVEITCIPEGEYREKILKAKEEGNLPSIFMADGIEEELLSSAMSLEDVYKDLSMSDYYCLEDYEDSGDLRVLPTGLDIPVAYVRRSDALDPSGVEVNSFGQFTESPSAGYYVSEKYLAMQVGSFGGNIAFEDKLKMDDKATGMITEIRDKAYAAGSEDGAFDAFSKGEITYYLSGMGDFDRFDDLAGLYEVKPVSTEDLYGRFCDCWCIKDGLGRAEKAAAEQFLISLLSKDEQLSAYVVYGDSIPVNKEAFSEYIRLNEKLQFLENDLKKMRFVFGDQTKMDSAIRDLFEKVIVNKTKTIQEWLEEQ